MFRRRRQNPLRAFDAVNFLESLMNSASKSNKSRPRLIFEISVVLCCKLAFIFGLWYFFFGPDKRIEQTPENVASGILMRSAPSSETGK